MTAPRQQLHQQAAAYAPPDTLHSRHGVSAHVPATVGADSLTAFVAPSLGIQHGPAAEHSSEKPAVPGPAGGDRDEPLPKRAFISFTPVASRAHSGLPAAKTPIAPTQRPSAIRKVRSVVRREDILEELHVAVRLREAPLPRGQKLQSLWSACQPGNPTLPTAAAPGACSDTLPKQFRTIIARSDSWLPAAVTECGGDSNSAPLQTHSAERQRLAAPPEASATPGRRSQALPGAAGGAGETSAARASSRTMRPSLSAASSARKVQSVSVSSGSRFYANIVAKLHREHVAREEVWRNDKWLVDVRSQQESPRRAREHRTQKVQSDY
jgi:hypothetical protein